MSIEIMSKAWNKSRQSGARLLALLALADRADEDGVCWPGREWIAERTRVRKDNLKRILRALEEAGEIAYDPGRGRGHKTYYLVAIALEPAQIKEIAMRRFEMDEEQATLFVSRIVNRQLQHELTHSSRTTTSSAEKKGAVGTPFSGKGGRRDPFSQKGSAQTPFRPEKGVPPAREKGSLGTQKRGPASPPDPSLIHQDDPSLIDLYKTTTTDKEDRTRAREALPGPPTTPVVVDVVVDSSLSEIFSLAEIFPPAPQQIATAWKEKTGRALEPADILAWHLWREVQNRNGGRPVGQGLIISYMKEGQAAPDEFYRQARERLAEVKGDYENEADEASATLSPETERLHLALLRFLPPATDLAQRDALVGVAEALNAEGFQAEDVEAFRLYWRDTHPDAALPFPTQLPDRLTDPQFTRWREHRAEAEAVWKDIRDALIVQIGAVNRDMGWALRSSSALSMTNGELRVWMPTSTAAEWWRHRGQPILERVIDHSLNITFIS